MSRQLLVPAILSLAILMASEPVAPLGKYTAIERKHWAFVKRGNPAVPQFAQPADRAFIANPVDAFVLARLRKEDLRPSPRADRITLIRRLSFDLTGLPPAPKETAAFVSDPSPKAYENLVERLLNSPHYGERWGQHWLDVARFAETDGFEYDTHRKDAWRYRDYVIRAFNNDKPYDRFLMEQLAGDEISPAEDETLIAAGFNRLGPLRKNAGNQEVASSRNEVLTEMTNAVGGALLGVTLGCARCHDHKFDPIRQSDYYRIQAYFSAVHDKDISKATPEEQKAWKEKAEPLEAAIKKLRSAMKGRTPDEREAILKKIEDMQEQMPEPLPALFTVTADPAKATPVHLLARGDYQHKGDLVGPRPLGVLLPESAPETGDVPNPRTQLAKWITDPENPLTARVMVNRIWQYHFGRGIVGTPNDFGRMGERPTHPELLDWLANEFVQSGFSVKHIHRLILMSNTWQQTSSPEPNAAAEEKDSDNKLLWKFSRRRLEAEEIRDAMLASAGTLNPKTGGPSVIIPIEKELVNALYKPAQWAVTQDPREHSRRSIYLIAKRNLHLPMMEVFDAPDSLVSCPRRETSTHAPQALELMNGALANQQAEALTRRLEREAGPDPRKQAGLGWRLVTGRAPTPLETQLAVKYLKTGSKKEFALALFNLNAFLYVN